MKKNFVSLNFIWCSFRKFGFCGWCLYVLWLLTICFMLSILKWISLFMWKILFSHLWNELFYFNTAYFVSNNSRLSNLWYFNRFFFSFYAIHTFCFISYHHILYFPPWIFKCLFGDDFFFYNFTIVVEVEQAEGKRSFLCIHSNLKI